MYHKKSLDISDNQSSRKVIGDSRNEYRCVSETRHRQGVVVLMPRGAKHDGSLERTVGNFDNYGKLIYKEHI